MRRDTDFLIKALKMYFGFSVFKGNQEAIVRSVLANKDTFVLMPSGSGKSLCYQLPALLMEGTAIIISPLIALMKNQVDLMRNCSEGDGIAHIINSSLNKSTLNKVQEDVKQGKTKLLYVAPESLTKEENIEFLRQIPISFYAIDEAHCISEWGHDFRPEYRKIRPIINRITPHSLVALTASATPKVQCDIQKNLDMQDATVFKSSFNRVNLYYEIRSANEDKEKDIIKFIKSNSGKSGIIYCLSRKRVETFAEKLQVNGIRALAYHAGMDLKVRGRNQDSFLMERADVIVATIAFGMGIDKPNIRYVIHYDIPKSLESYYQETGRAGRDGGEGTCIVFYTRKDLQKMEKIMQSKSVSEWEIGRQLLGDVRTYMESSMCRRKVLLHYFGEEYNEKNCGKCDNCLNAKSQVEAKKLLIMVLETIESLQDKFKMSYIVDILRGEETHEIVSYKHNKLKVFGDGRKESEDTWNAVIHQAVVSGFLCKEIENYGLLKLTVKGKEYLDKPTSFKIAKKEDIDQKENIEGILIPEGITSVLDSNLFLMMKDLRKKLSKQYNIPPYVIFQDVSLEAMSTFYPITIEELQTIIPGVGAGKAHRYGQEFVELIKRYVIENEIERSEDIRVRTVPNKSKLKVFIIQKIDYRVDLYEVALEKGLEFDELLDEIEAIVYSGTKINIDYFIEQTMEKERIENIYQYFEKSKTDTLKEAFEELGNSYTKEEVRLMRIKFLSELAN